MSTSGRGWNRREFIQTAGLATTAMSGAGLGMAACGDDSGQRPSGPRINYWHHFTNQTEMKGLREVMAMFSREHPGIELAQENIPNKDFMAKFTAAVQAGTRPHTTMVTSDRLGNMVAMGGLVDLSERVDRWELKGHFPGDRWAGVSVGDAVYGVPAFAFVDWMYYRRDWFEEAGIAGPPATLEEFQEAAVRLTDPARGRYGFGMRAGDGGHNHVIDMIEAFGSPIVAGGKARHRRGQGGRGPALLLRAVHRSQGGAAERAERQLPPDNGGVSHRPDRDAVARHRFAHRGAALAGSGAVHDRPETGRPGGPGNAPRIPLQRADEGGGGRCLLGLGELLGAGRSHSEVHGDHRVLPRIGAGCGRPAGHGATRISPSPWKR